MIFYIINLVSHVHEKGVFGAILVQYMANNNNTFFLDYPSKREDSPPFSKDKNLGYVPNTRNLHIYDMENTYVVFVMNYRITGPFGHFSLKMIMKSSLQRMIKTTASS